MWGWGSGGIHEQNPSAPHVKATKWDICDRFSLLYYMVAMALCQNVHVESAKRHEGLMRSPSRSLKHGASWADHKWGETCQRYASGLNLPTGFVGIKTKYSDEIHIRSTSVGWSRFLSVLAVAVATDQPAMISATFHRVDSPLLD